MIDAEMTNEPTNMAEENVASYRFIHAVRNINPVKDVAIPISTKM
jgi:hypothetical protein